MYKRQIVSLIIKHIGSICGYVPYAPHDIYYCFWSSDRLSASWSKFSREFFHPCKFFWAMVDSDSFVGQHFTDKVVSLCQQCWRAWSNTVRDFTIFNEETRTSSCLGISSLLRSFWIICCRSIRNCVLCRLLLQVLQSSKHGRWICSQDDAHTEEIKHTCTHTNTHKHTCT